MRPAGERAGPVENGKRLATASFDWAVKIWDADTGKELLTLKGWDTSTATWSPDGKRVVTPGKDITAKVWAIETKQ